MTTAILRGKPDAGNPHVRFDEGEVASAKPRRGSLLYKERACEKVRCALVLVLVTVVCAAGGVELDTSADRVRTPLWVPLRRAGTLRPRSTHEIKGSNWTLGCECIDRDLVNFDAYRRFLAPLGIKTIRIQGGWQKCEKVKGAYEFGWLDHVVDAAAEDGISCYLDTEYNNTNYSEGGVDLGAKFPSTPEALRGWDNWVDALSKHFKGRVRDWSMWNEPWCIPDEIVSNNVRTAKIIRRNIPDARIGALSLGDCSPARIESCVRAMGEDRHLFTWIVYHGYTYAPEQRYEDVDEIRAMLDRLFPEAILRQGENGCPSEYLPHGWVLNGVPWSEYSQAKWIMRRMLGDLGHDVLSGVFQIVDFYNPKRKLVDGVTNTKGLLRTDRSKNVIDIKLSYYAVQNLVSVFDDRWTRVRDSKFETTDPGIARYEYVRESGARMYVFWRFDDAHPQPVEKGDMIRERDPLFAHIGEPVRPGDGFVTVPQVFKVKDGRPPLEDPVWVDLFTGQVYDFPKTKVSASPDAVYYMSVPVYDSPCLLVERAALDLMK